MTCHGLTAGLIALFFASFAHSADRGIASVNGKAITEQDLHFAVGGYNEGLKKQILADKYNRDQIVEDLIGQEVLAQEAARRKMDQTAEYKKAFEAFRKQYLANALVQAEIAPQVTEAAARAFYKSNSLRYNTTQVHAQHILLNTKEEAEKVLKMAQETYNDFQVLAETYSKDPSAKNNRGDLGFFTRDRMTPDLSDPIFRAKDESIIGPLKSTFGWHIVKVMERKVGPDMTYDEVELRVKSDLRADLTRKLLVSLKRNSKIERSSASR